MNPTRLQQRAKALAVGVGLAAILLPSLACPAFDPEFGEIGVPEVRSVREQAAQMDAIVELRLAQLLGPAMRSSQVDCWVIVWEAENRDPLVPFLALAGTAPDGRAVLLLCADESGGSTRVALGNGLEANAGLYDLAEVADEDLGSAMAERVAALDPSRIAVNRSPGRPYADGLSASNEAWLRQALGASLSDRIVPSGPFVEAWLGRHLDVEAPLFSEAARLTVGLLEQVLSDEYIVAAGTSVSELTWAARQRARDMGLTIAVPPQVYLQRGGPALGDAGAAGLDVLLQTGDLIFLTVGIEYLGCVTHYGRWVYMLHEEERQAPEWVLEGLSTVADELEAALPKLRSGLGAERMSGSFAEGPESGFASSIAVGRVGYLVDRGVMSTQASPGPSFAMLWQAEPALQPGSLVAVRVSRGHAEASWQEAGVWIASLENIIVGEEGARLLVPAQRVPYLID